MSSSLLLLLRLCGVWQEQTPVIEPPSTPDVPVHEPPTRSVSQNSLRRCRDTQEPICRSHTHTHTHTHTYTQKPHLSISFCNMANTAWQQKHTPTHNMVPCCSFFFITPGIKAKSSLMRQTNEKCAGCWNRIKPVRVTHWIGLAFNKAQCCY